MEGATREEMNSDEMTDEIISCCKSIEKSCMVLKEKEASKEGLLENVRPQDFEQIKVDADRILLLVRTMELGKIVNFKPRKRKSRKADPLQCRFCLTMETPEWRKGPSGPRTLCNACGLHWAKTNKLETPAVKKVKFMNEQQELTAKLGSNALMNPVHAVHMANPSALVLQETGNQSGLAPQDTGKEIMEKKNQPLPNLRENLVLLENVQAKKPLPSINQMATFQNNQIKSQYANYSARMPFYTQKAPNGFYRIQNQPTPSNNKINQYTMSGNTYNPTYGNTYNPAYNGNSYNPIYNGNTSIYGGNMNGNAYNPAPIRSDPDLNVHNSAAYSLAELSHRRPAMPSSSSSYSVPYTKSNDSYSNQMNSSPNLMSTYSPPSNPVNNPPSPPSMISTPPSPSN